MNTIVVMLGKMNGLGVLLTMHMEVQVSRLLGGKRAAQALVLLNCNQH